MKSKFFYVLLIFLTIIIIIFWNYRYIIKNTRYGTIRDKSGFCRHGAFEIIEKVENIFRKKGRIHPNYSLNKNKLKSIYLKVFENENHIPIDAYRKKSRFYETDGWRPNYRSGYWGDYFDYISDGKSFIFILSVGPNRKRDFINPKELKGKTYIDAFIHILKYAYDPTNGTDSGGDLFFTQELISF